MNESVVSNQEGPESSANLDEFGDYKADEMNSSLLSERDIADNWYSFSEFWLCLNRIGVEYKII